MRRLKPKLSLRCLAGVIGGGVLGFFTGAAVAPVMPAGHAFLWGAIGALGGMLGNLAATCDAP